MNYHIKYLIISYIFVYGQKCNANEIPVNNITVTDMDATTTPLPPNTTTTSTTPAPPPSTLSLMPSKAPPSKVDNNKTIVEKIEIINLPQKSNETIEVVKVTSNGSLDEDSAAMWLMKLHRFGEDTLKVANKTNIFVVYSVNIVVCIVAVMGLLLGLFKCYRPRQWLLHTFLRDFRRMINADQQQQKI